MGNPTLKGIKQIVFAFRPQPRISGGARKMLDYIGHARSFPDWQPVVHLPPHLKTAGGAPNAPNAYLNHLDPNCLVDDISALRPDVVFSTIGFKPYLRECGAWNDDVPLVRLLQGFGSLDPSKPSYRRQCDPCITICVSEGLGRAFRELCPNQPSRIIPNAVDADEIVRVTAGVVKRELVTVFGVKNKPLGRSLERRIAGMGIPVRGIHEIVDRERYLRAIAESAIALFVPHRVEGFFMPVIGSFAVRTLVVCPDARGNRDTLRDGFNGIVTAYDEDAMAAGLERGLRLSNAERNRLLGNASATLNERHTILGERAGFRRVLNECGPLWRGSDDVT